MFSEINILNITQFLQFYVIHLESHLLTKSLSNPDEQKDNLGLLVNVTKSKKMFYDCKRAKSRLKYTVFVIKINYYIILFIHL